jgi:hypothetical protein
MANKETTLSQDVKTMWADGCKSVVEYLQSFGKPKEEPEYTNVDKGFTKEAVKEWKKYGMMTKEKPKRARGKKGRYLADDKSTAYTNEAWVGGKAPKRGKK